MSDTMIFRLKALMLALAIGGATVFGAWLAIKVPFGDAVAKSGDDWLGLLMETLVVALPFVGLALLAERSRSLWGSGLALTLLPWGLFVYEAIRYRMQGSSVLAHMGFDVLLFFYPILLAAILAVVSIVRKLLVRYR